MNSGGTKSYWSMTEGVFNCLIDERRTKAFIRAIINSVKKDDVVVDLGTGSGILAMAAARAGARKVYAVENDLNNLHTLEQTFFLNGLSDQIELIHADATKVTLPERFDVVVAEMIATALIEESQVPVMNNILRYKKKDSKVLLEQYVVLADPVFNRSKYYGFDFGIVRYEYPDEKNLKSLSFARPAQLASINFREKVSDCVVEKKLQFPITKDGLCNAIRLSGKTVFCDGSQLGGTFAYSYPLILPVKKMRLKKGQTLSLEIKYVMSGGMSTLKYSVRV